jgi:hypothetical protein
MKTKGTNILEGSERELATGVLKQTMQDLRRFRNATTPIERELYFDVYSWLVSNDSRWPFSFLNVCQLLNRSPEDLRDELLSDLPLNMFSYWTRCGGRAARWLGMSISRIFATKPGASATTPASLMQTSYSKRESSDSSKGHVGFYGHFSSSQATDTIRCSSTVWPDSTFGHRSTSYSQMSVNRGK